jgi:DNA-binding YbaB/EbfC family protein
VSGEDAEDGEQGEDSQDRGNGQTTAAAHHSDEGEPGADVQGRQYAEPTEDVGLEGPGQQSLPDLGALLSKLGEVQQNLQQAQETAAAKVLEGRAGGGAVRVRATGGLEFEAVVIDPSVVDPDDVDLLQDLILAALRDVVEQAHTETAQVLGGIDLEGGLGGLLGG